MASGTAGRVLVVQEDLFLRDLFGYVLERAGYEVTLAADHNKARPALGKGKEICDVVVLAADSRGAPATELTAEIRAMADAPSLVLTSSSGRSPEFAEALERGEALLLDRSFQSKDLVWFVEIAKGRSRRERRLDSESATPKAPTSAG